MDLRLPPLPLLLGRNARSANLFTPPNLRSTSALHSRILWIYRFDFVLHFGRTSCFLLPSALFFALFLLSLAIFLSFSPPWLVWERKAKEKRDMGHVFLSDEG